MLYQSFNTHGTSYQEPSNMVHHTNLGTTTTSTTTTTTIIIITIT